MSDYRTLRQILDLCDKLYPDNTNSISVNLEAIGMYLRSRRGAVEYTDRIIIKYCRN